MMEAVAQKKAGWLFDKRSQKSFFDRKRPQEDLVTSAVFGALRLLSARQRTSAIKLLVGERCYQASGFEKAAEQSIRLWPSLLLPGRRRVEPDVLLQGDGSTLIIEVKWHANLSERQLEQQIAAAQNSNYNVSATLVMGEAGVASSIANRPCFRRTWRQISADLSNAVNDPSIGPWCKQVHDFLQQTDKGHTFAGLKPLPHQSVTPCQFAFTNPGQPPWLCVRPQDVFAVWYKFGD